MKRPEKFSRQKGSAVMIIVLLMAVLAFIPVIMQLTMISSVKTQQQILIGVQSDSVARAGVMDAVSWFRRQSIQPVRQGTGMTYPDAAFNPLYNSSSTLSDTDDQDIGLVRSYQLSSDNKIWARYEVKKQSDPVLGYDPHAVHDVTDKRVEGHAAGEGLAWYIESIGYVYRRDDPNAAYNVAPNVVLSKSRASTEIRRISLSLPAECAMVLNSIHAQNTRLEGHAKITGGNNIGIGYYEDPAPPNNGGPAGKTKVSGTPSMTAINTASQTAISTLSIFGVPKSDIKLMADISITTVSELTGSYPSSALVYIDGNATFDGTHPLRGGGILYVNGNLMITSGSNAYFSGLVYVAGNFEAYGPCTFSGSVIVEGEMRLHGSPDVAEIIYDASILSSVRQQVAQYRENKSTYFNFSGLK